ncbi:MAG: YceI family protein [Rhodobacteraceae bacterium]|nr:YceI family protein [Paracoccaceae bacterium]
MSDPPCCKAAPLPQIPALMMALALALWAGVAVATPQRYALLPETSVVGFSFTLNGIATEGQMPVARADIVIDPNDLGAATADVRLSVAGARTGLIFATEALKGASVLDAARFPEIRFRSDSVRLSPGGRLSDGATITGQLQVRDVTRTVTLIADVYRAAGTRPDDLGRLSIRLRGSISRSAFGATGYGDIVGDEVLLNVMADLRRTP